MKKVVLKNKLMGVSLMAVAALLVGCGNWCKRGKKGAVESAPVAAPAHDEKPASAPEAAAASNTVFFRLDSSEIDDANLPAVVKYVQEAAQAQAGAPITYTGHCCKLGKPGYNVGLGERRAKALHDAVGVPGKIVSYGQSAVFVEGDAEEQLSQNRRGIAHVGEVSGIPNGAPQQAGHGKKRKRSASKRKHKRSKKAKKEDSEKMDEEKPAAVEAAADKSSADDKAGEAAPEAAEKANS